MRIARFGWEGFVQVLGQGLAGSRAIAREIERVRESPCAWITRRDERTHLEPCRAAAISSAIPSSALELPPAAAVPDAAAVLATAPAPPR